MKKDELVNQVAGKNWGSLVEPITQVMKRSEQDANVNSNNRNSLLATRMNNKGTMQPHDEFRYSGRCFCGSY